ncbi:uroporphyrinogen-III C-methyltransferase [Escherichia coli]
MQTPAADMNDPSLITVRRAITDDIASLSAVSQGGL